jgi:hypothetical protein
MENTNSTTGKLRPVIPELQTLLGGNLELKRALLSSLTIVLGMYKTLDAPFYNGLNKMFNVNAWPTAIEKYCDYLNL